jgi:leucyl aminopeptidase
MHPAYVTRGDAASIPIWFVTAATWRDIRAGLDERACAFAQAAGFEPSPGRHALLPGPDGTLGAVLFGLEDDGKPFNPFLPGTLAGVLSRGVYRFANAARDQRLAAIAVALGAYRFVRYGKPANGVRLEVPEQTDGADLTRIVEAVYLARDLINTPANVGQARASRGRRMPGRARPLCPAGGALWRLVARVTRTEGTVSSV